MEDCQKIVVCFLAFVVLMLGVVVLFCVLVFRVWAELAFWASRIPESSFGAYAAPGCALISRMSS